MNRHSVITPLLLCASLAFAGVPYTFGPGSPARAQEVNDNFAALDTAIQKKTDKTELQDLSSALSAKATSQDLSDLAKRLESESAARVQSIADSVAELRKSTSSALTQSALTGIRDTLRTKLDTSFRSQVALKTATGIQSQNYWLSETEGTSTLGTPKYGIGKTSSDNQIVVGGDNGLHLKTASNDLVVPSAGDPTLNGSKLWHAGNLKPDSLPYIRAIRTGNAVGTPFQIGYGVGGEGAAVVRDWRNINSPGEYYNQRVTTFELNWYNQSWLLSQFRSGTSPSGRFSISFYDYSDKSTSEYFGIHPDGNAFFNKSLSVEGTFHATTTTAAIRASDVADYVFEPDYKLSSLSEVEEYTKANKHLHEVPSASELEASGIDLAKMNMLLLKKVEELTLHAIEQNKRIEAQEQRLGKQQDQLDALILSSRRSFE